jgi:uncharacterized protein (DUF1330 family)
MAAYVIATIQVTDPEAYPDYTKLSGPAIARYGGRFVVRGGPLEVLEGSLEADRVVVIGFDTKEQAMMWWNSPEYEAAKSLRRRASTGTFVLVEGLPR